MQLQGLSGKQKLGCRWTRSVQPPQLRKPREQEIPNIIATTITEDPRLKMNIKLGKYVFQALIDTGAVRSYIGDNVIHKCRNMLRKIRHTPQKARLANNHIVQISGEYEGQCEVQQLVLSGIFLHLPALSSDIIIGMDLLREWNISINIQTGQIKICGTDKPRIQRRNEKPLGEISDLPENQKNHTEQFLEEEIKQFKEVTGTTPLIEHEIKLKTRTPIKQRYRPRNPAMQDIINQELDKMLKDNIIEPSDSPWSSPIVLIKKKDNTYRFCVDFRMVNSVAHKDAYPLPYISAILDKLRTANYIYQRWL